MTVKRAQSEEVELHQAGGLDVVLVELRDHAAALVIGVQRREFRQLRGRDHHAAGVHAGVAREPFERLRQVDEVLDLLVFLVEPLELGLLLQRVIQRDAEFEGNQLGDLVDVAITHAEHAAHVAHHRLRSHGAVGDDLRHAFAAIFLRHVFDDAIAPVHAEVDVEVGHRHAFRVEESLEQQVVLERVDVGDAEAVRHQRSGAGATAWSHRYAVGARPADEIRDDEEVACEAHLADDHELGIETLAVFVDARTLRLVEGRRACREAAFRFLADIGLDRDAFRQGKTGSRDSPSFSGNEQRRAISTELRSASGMSANRRAISSGERRYCASV